MSVSDLRWLPLCHFLSPDVCYTLTRQSTLSGTTEEEGRRGGAAWTLKGGGEDVGWDRMGGLNFFRMENLGHKRGQLCL